MAVDIAVTRAESAAVGEERPVPGPTWLNWAFAGVMAMSALCHAGRLVLARQGARTHGCGIDLTHLVTSCAMAAMLVVTFGARLATAVVVAVGVPTVWLILRALRALITDRSRAFMHPAFTQPGQQALMGIAMLFMLIVTRSPAASAAASSGPSAGVAMTGMAMPGMAMGGQAGIDAGAPTSSMVVTSLVPLVLVGVLGLVAARYALQLSVAVATQRAGPTQSRPDLRARTSGLLLTPGLSLGCQLAMSGTMIYMLALLV
jgi:hypothetical protein